MAVGALAIRNTSSISSATMEFPVMRSISMLIAIQAMVQHVSIEPGWRTDHPTGTSGPWDGLKRVKKPGVPAEA